MRLHISIFLVATTFKASSAFCVESPSGAMTNKRHSLPAVDRPKLLRNNSPSDNMPVSGQSSSKSPYLVIQKMTCTIFLSLALSFSPVSNVVDLSLPSQPHRALAADYGSLSDEQKAVAEAWRLVDNSYLDRTFNKQDWFQMRQNAVKKRYRDMNEARDAIRDMISSLGDKYTRYLSPSKYQSIVDSATGTLAGVGIEIARTDDGRIMASDVEANAPAAKGGVLPGDIFVEVDGVRFDKADDTPDDVAVNLRGPVGSKVGVVMERNGKTLDYILTREPIKITSVKSYETKIDKIGKVGVIQIKSFSGTTADTVKTALNDLKKKGAKAIVFDIRSNPGGLLPGGVDTASLFLDANKPIVFVVNKKGIVDAQATLGPGIDLETPLVVLVDGNTASAAEVFAAALKENGRANVVGKQTFGKGVVQTVRELSNNNGGVAITVARYETPDHNDINKQGIPVNFETPVDCPRTDASSCLNPSLFKYNRP